HSRQRGDIALAIVSAVDDFVIALRKALEARTCEDFQPRKQCDLVLNIAAMGEQLGCAVERKIVRRRRVEEVGIKVALSGRVRLKGIGSYRSIGGASLKTASCTTCCLPYSNPIKTLCSIGPVLKIPVRSVCQS